MVSGSYGQEKIGQNRKCYRTIAFRFSDLEDAESKKRVELSGLQKQDHLFLKSVLFQKINVVGNKLMFERIHDLLIEI
jgi:hypothetical protein